MKRTRSDLIRVGIFTVISGSLLAGGLLWIAGSQLLRPRASYTVLFEDSVTGLAAGSTVEYQGVSVGRVRDIELTRDIPPKVAVTVDLEPGTQVRRDTIAALLGSIVTGIQYIELQGGSEAGGELPPGGVIPGSVSSLLDFRDRVARISDSAITILARLEKNVFNEENTGQVNLLVTNLSKAAERLASAAEAFQGEDAPQQLVHMVERVSAAADAINVLFSDVYAHRELYTTLGQTFDTLDAAVADARSLVGEARSELRGVGGAAEAVLQDLRFLTRRLEETLDVIESDPSMLLRGRAIEQREWEQ